MARKTEDRGQKTEDGRRETEDGRQETQGGGRNADGTERKMQAEGPRLAVTSLGHRVHAEPKRPEARSLPLRPIVRRLLRWFAQQARPLPWRRRYDPYAVWVAEVMLQQTQVQTVGPYWRRWMRAMPSFRALAQARLPQVLKLWEGLGYYRRARHLHRAARLVLKRHGGRFPRRCEQVLALPGVGRYTAGAICSIAFNQPTPVLDGNVTRVLIRLQALADDPRRAHTRSRLWQLAGALVAHAAAEPAYKVNPQRGRYAGNCSMLNQALMELGATVCTPRNPRCAACPLRRWCRAFHTGQPAQWPRPQRRPPGQRVQVVAFVVISRRGGVLLRQRPPHAVNGGLWELPNLEVNGSEWTPQTALKVCVPGAVGALAPLGQVRHAIGCRRITLHAYGLRVAERQPGRLLGGRWVSVRALARLPLAAAHRRVLDQALARIRLPEWPGLTR